MRSSSAAAVHVVDRVIFSRSQRECCKIPRQNRCKFGTSHSNCVGDALRSYMNRMFSCSFMHVIDHPRRRFCASCASISRHLLKATSRSTPSTQSLSYISSYLLETMASATKHTTVAQGVPEVGAPFQRVEFELPSLLPKDVEVRVSHCGFCHTDLHEGKGISCAFAWISPRRVSFGSSVSSSFVSLSFVVSCDEVGYRCLQLRLHIVALMVGCSGWTFRTSSRSYHSRTRSGWRHQRCWLRSERLEGKRLSHCLSIYDRLR